MALPSFHLSIDECMHKTKFCLRTTPLSWFYYYETISNKRSSLALLQVEVKHQQESHSLDNCASVIRPRLLVHSFSPVHRRIIGLFGDVVSVACLQLPRILHKPRPTLGIHSQSSKIWFDQTWNFAGSRSPHDGRYRRS